MIKKIPNGRILFTAIFLFLMILAGCSKQTTEYISADSEQTHTDVEQTQPDSEDTSFDQKKKDKVKPLVYVYICGAVANPGVYKVEQGTRLFEVVSLAGGFIDSAAIECINQAQKVEDGQMVYILTKQEQQGEDDLPAQSPQTKINATDSENEKVNINTATQEELMTLPGIGKSKVDRILKYKEDNGPFKSVEEIMKIEGIKEGVFSKIKDRIRVN